MDYLVKITIIYDYKFFLANIEQAKTFLEAQSNSGRKKQSEKEK